MGDRTKKIYLGPYVSEVWAWAGCSKTCLARGLTMEFHRQRGNQGKLCPEYCHPSITAEVTAGLTYRYIIISH